MTQQNEAFAVGSLISVRNSTDSGCWLGLVVNQDAGKNWAERDPCIEYDPPEKQGFILARVLGMKLTEGMSTGRTGLRKQEPHQITTVRWAYVQLNQAYVVAGPDVASIENFLKQSRICESLGMEGAAFLHDVKLIAEYLHGVKRTKDETSYFDRTFLAMLKEVLPR